MLLITVMVLFLYKYLTIFSINISNLLLHKILSRGHLLSLGIACSNLLIDVIIQIQDRRKYGVHVLLEADIFGKSDPTFSLRLQYSPCKTCYQYCS